MTSQTLQGLQGTLQVPGDKSISHRALMFSALAQGTSRIRGLLPSADVQSTWRCLAQLGIGLSGIPHHADSEITVTSKGLPWQEPADILDCGNSGTTIRLMTGLLAGQPFYSVLTGDASIRRRPMGRVVDPLRLMGANIAGRSQGKLAPVTIQPPAAGALNGMTYTMPVASAQVKSAILLAGLLANEPTTVIEQLPTRDHTERMLTALNAPLIAQGAAVTIEPLAGRTLSPCDWQIPGDPSSAAFWMVAALLVPGSQLQLRNVGLNPTRTGLIRALQSVGGLIEVENQRLVGGELIGDLIVSSSELVGDLTLVADHIPALIDEIPILTIAGLYLKGTLTVRGAEELRKKESDRLDAMAQELAKLGIQYDLLEDGFILTGQPDRALSHPSRPLNSWHDHRIAMSLTILNVIANARQGVSLAADWSLEGGDCVAISYPDFHQDLARLTGGERVR